jgi:hypothetical protein
VSGLPAFIQPLGGTLDLSPFQDQPVFRAVGQIQAQVTVEEDHDDELQIVEHPVEFGANIADHAFRRPAELRLRLGWTQSGAYIRGQSFGQPLIGGPTSMLPAQVSDVRAMYERLLELQRQRLPFEVWTGKRHYTNMLVAGIRVHTDAKFEWSLLADVVLREVLLAHTQTLTASQQAAQGALTVQASPEANAPTLTQGGVQPQPANVPASKVTDMGGNLSTALPTPSGATPETALAGPATGTPIAGQPAEPLGGSPTDPPGPMGTASTQAHGRGIEPTIPATPPTTAPAPTDTLTMAPEQPTTPPVQPPPAAYQPPSHGRGAPPPTTVARFTPPPDYPGLFRRNASADYRRRMARR